jgi:hypothetical protein
MIAPGERKLTLLATIIRTCNAGLSGFFLAQLLLTHHFFAPAASFSLRRKWCRQTRHSTLS